MLSTDPMSTASSIRAPLFTSIVILTMGIAAEDDDVGAVWACALLAVEARDLRVKAKAECRAIKKKNGC